MSSTGFNWSILPLFLLLIFGACTKNVPGPKGDPGTPGLAGNLIQTSTGSIKVDSASWKKVEYHWECFVPVAEITAKVGEQGEVRVYIQSESEWWSLPHSHKRYILFQYAMRNGGVQLFCDHIHGDIPTRPATANYRVVVFSPA